MENLVNALSYLEKNITKLLDRELKTILKIKDNDNLDCSLSDIIVKNFLHLIYFKACRLLPFSIDELLDSIKFDKIDTLNPLGSKKSIYLKL
ncbi:hypothetical protein LBMAG18_03770 [Alphaproteobacteria bacterium]|nr:hypothetical protein LBMAG18_03770 [Alphaproteobacteria bacterium]